ncbi:acyltransferase family protein [Cerasicoccus maritimus]|uniref:acyltransferase family protein n=1 Tax=Cerasicoccus maritimus TaxID=490089 RepID=UPI0028526A83|nr:acyltransferase family protein [Cerasicoccus maritimus]
MIRYRSDIDGLRAIAVIPVVLYHLNPQWVPGGYLGVDVFFVISGYLICRIILREVQAGTFTFRKFWLRRVKRLFPVSASVISVSMVIGYFTLFYDEWKSMAIQAASSLLCASNIYYWKHANNYWGSQVDDMPFLHTWSLSIEEQFYLLFPLFLFLITRFQKQKYLFWILVTLVFSLSLSIVTSILAKSANFYLLPTRAWELLLGCALAASSLKNSNPQKVGHWWSALGLAAILASFTHGWNYHSYSSVGQLLATIGSTLLIWKCAPNAGPVGKLLSARPIVFIGKISYSLYLWHWPVIIISRYIDEFNPLVIFCAVLGLSVISYYLIEQQTRYLKNSAFGLVFAGGVVALIATLTMPFYTNRDMINYNKPTFWYSVSLNPRLKEKAEYNGHNGDYRTGLLLDDLPADGRLDILVIGDSHSAMYLPAIKKAAELNNMTVGYYGSGDGASPFFVEGMDSAKLHPKDFWDPNVRKEYDQYRLDFIAKYNPRIIFVGGRWESWQKKLGSESLAFHVDSLINRLGDSKVYFITQPPVLPFGTDRFNSGLLDHPRWRGFEEHKHNTQKRNDAHETIENITKRYDNSELISTESIFQTNSSIHYLEGNEILYTDDDHLSVYGALKCVEVINKALN